MLTVNSSFVFIMHFFFLNCTNNKLFFYCFRLVRDWLSLVPPTAAVAGLGYMSYLAFCPKGRPQPKQFRVNRNVRLNEAKVADFVDVEDIAEKAAFCRCWKSKNVSKFI